MMNKHNNTFCKIWRTVLIVTPGRLEKSLISHCIVSILNAFPKTQICIPDYFPVDDRSSGSYLSDLEQLNNLLESPENVVVCCFEVDKFLFTCFHFFFFFGFEWFALSFGKEGEAKQVQTNSEGVNNIGFYC